MIKKITHTCTIQKNMCLRKSATQNSVQIFDNKQDKKTAEHKKNTKKTAVAIFN